MIWKQSVILLIFVLRDLTVDTQYRKRLEYNSLGWVKPPVIHRVQLSGSFWFVPDPLGPHDWVGQWACAHVLFKMATASASSSASSMRLEDLFSVIHRDLPQ